MKNWLPALPALPSLDTLTALTALRPASFAGPAAAILGALALVTVSCAAPEYAGRPSGPAGTTIVFPGMRGVLRVPAQTHTVTVPVKPLATPVAVQPAPTVEPVAPVIEPEPTPEPVAEPEPIGPLPGGTAYIPQVERWRPLVRELIAEARAEGRLQGNAGRIDEDLVLAVIQQESGGDPNAMSWAGARGLMQLMPPSFAWIMGIANWGQDISHMDPNFIFDPSTNLRAGIRFLGAVLEEQSGSVYWALASYNAGGGNVFSWRRSGLTEIPPAYGGGETANYVPAILGNYNAHRPA